jgi:hypothetical protein
MFKFSKERLLYVATMLGLFTVLDLCGVSHGDKLALSVLVGVLGPLYAPRLSAKLLNQPREQS